ncbi:MAG: serine protease, partial [Deinococcota bacterium]
LTQGIVLTAAHCFVDSGVTSPSNLRVRTSTATLETPEASLGDIFTVRRIVIHENYATARGYDIALLELASLSEQPTIPLLTDNLEDLTAPLASAVVIGWGSLADGSVPVTLQEANSTLVDPQVCFDNDNFFTDDRELCILQVGGNAAPCFGDSGGPLLVHDDRGIWHHAGVLSRGSVPCGEAGDPDIYTSAVALTDWILENATEVSRGYRVQVDPDEVFNDLDFGNTNTLEPTGSSSQLAQAYITNLQITGLPATNTNRLIRIDTPITFSWQVAEGSPGMVCELDVDDNGRTDFETSCEGGTYSFDFEGYNRNVSYTPTLSIELDGAVRQRRERINVISPDNEDIGVPEGRNGSLSLGDSVIARRFIDYYDLETNGTQTVTIELESSDFDPFLQLFDRDSFELIDANDDGGPGLDSRLVFTPEVGRRYLIGVTSARIDTGRYVLRTLLE